MKKIIFTYFFLFFSLVSFGQVSNVLSPYDKLGFSNNGVSGGVNESFGKSEFSASPVDKNRGNMQQQDSIEPKKERKPLRSFYFVDSLQLEKIFSWTIDPSTNIVERAVVDTILDGHQIDYSYQKEELGAFSLGNLGGAILPVNYFRRSHYRDYKMLAAWENFIMRPERVLFYNSKIPYSRFEYQMSGQTKIEENICNILFSANFSPSSSFNFQYKSEGTNGMYMRQKALDRYFTLSFDHTGERYAIHMGYIYNYGNQYENGGIRDDREVTDTVYATANQVDVNLKNSENTYKGHTFWWTQSYAIPLRKVDEDENFTLEQVPTVYIGQSFNYSKFYRSYYGELDTALYKINYISDITEDTLTQSMTDVNLFAQFQPYNRNGAIGLITGGVGYEKLAYSYYVPLEHLESFDNGEKNGSSPYVYGGLDGTVSKYLKWGADLKYYFAGYKSQDLNVDGHLAISAYIKDRPLTLDLSASFGMATPDYWEQRYYSNHYVWQNEFTKENYLKLRGKFLIPSIKLEIGADYEMSKGKIYFDSLITPKQFDGNLSVLSFYLMKNFKAGGFHFNHRLLAQLSSDQTVNPLPLFSAYISYYFEFDIVKNVLRMQTGIDGRYNTSYYAQGWDPALGRFYNQRELEVGGYPYFDVFVNAKWKRMLILLKLQHFNCNFLPKTRNYFQFPHYPQNRMMFKFGFSWSFYD